VVTARAGAPGTAGANFRVDVSALVPVPRNGEDPHEPGLRKRPADQQQKEKAR
jgi:hypothetical protein